MTDSATPLIDTSQRDVVRVAGADAAAYLQSQLSQDVDAVAVGAATRSFVLQPDGHVVGWFRLVHTAEDEFLLVADPGAGAAIVARLERFKLRMRLDMATEVWTCTTTIGGPVPDAPGIGVDALTLPLDWPGVEGVERLEPGAPSGVPKPATTEVVDGPLDWVRIGAGVPRAGVDFTVDGKTIPAELGEWALRSAVSFTKGCYTGQELVARLNSRGNHVPKPLRLLRLAGEELPPHGAQVVAEDRESGHVTSVARAPDGAVLALAVVARRVEVPTEVSVRWDDHEARARVEVLPDDR